MRISPSVCLSGKTASVNTRFMGRRRELCASNETLVWPQLFVFFLSWPFVSSFVGVFVPKSSSSSYTVQFRAEALGLFDRFLDSRNPAYRAPYLIGRLGHTETAVRYYYIPRRPVGRAFFVTAWAGDGRTFFLRTLARLATRIHVHACACVVGTRTIDSVSVPRNADRPPLVAHTFRPCTRIVPIFMYESITKNRYVFVRRRRYVRTGGSRSPARVARMRERWSVLQRTDAGRSHCVVG